mgnify:CR=1 FL=1
MNEELSMNKLGTMKISKLMLSMGIPMILSMMLQSPMRITAKESTQQNWEK